MKKRIKFNKHVTHLIQETLFKFLFTFPVLYDRQETKSRRFPALLPISFKTATSQFVSFVSFTP